MTIEGRMKIVEGRYWKGCLKKEIEMGLRVERDAWFDGWDKWERLGCNRDSATLGAAICILIWHKGVLKLKIAMKSICISSHSIWGKA